MTLKSTTIVADYLYSTRYSDHAVDTSAAKEVSKTKNDSAMVIIGVAMLVVAFATLVLKIIEVARSK